MIYWVLASIVGFVIAVRFLVGRATGLVIFSVCCTIASVLYCCALAGCLAVAARVLFFGGFAAGGIALLAAGVKRRLRAVLRTALGPALVVFVLGTILYYVKFHDRGFYSSDEYFYWGRLVKVLIFTGELPGAERSAVHLKGYTPGASLFHYFFAKNSQYTEGNLFFAHFLLLFSSLMVFLNDVRWQRFPRGIPAVFLSLGAVLLFGGRLDLLLVDSLLALHFGMLMYAWVQGDHSARTLLLLIPPAFMLCLIKSTGYPLAVVAVALIALDQLWTLFFARRARRREQPQPDVGSNEPSRARVVLRRVGVGSLWVVLCASPFLARYSWERRIKALKITKRYDLASISSAEIRKAFSKEATPLQKNTIDSFCKAVPIKPLTDVQPIKTVTEWLARRNLSAVKSFFNQSVVGWCLIFLNLCFLCVILGRDRAYRFRIVTAFVVLYIGLGVYVAGLLLLYLFYFSPYDLAKLASYARYLNIYILGMFVFASGAVFVGLDSLWDRAKRIASRISIFLAVLLLEGLAAFLVCALVWDQVNLRILGGPTRVNRLRQRLEPKIASVLARVPLDKAVYVIYQGPSGYEKLIISYELAPRPTNRGRWSLGKPYKKGDVWTRELTPAQWVSILDKWQFDFVFLAKADERFWNEYAELFSADSRRDDILFAVVGLAPGKVTLRPLR